MNKEAVIILRKGVGLTHVDASVAVRLASTGQWHVTVVAPTSGKAPEDGHLRKLLRSVSGVEVAEEATPPRPSQAAFVWLGSDEFRSAADWIKLADRLVGVTSSTFPPGLRALAAQLVRQGRQAARSHVVLTEARSLTWNPYRGLSKVVRYDATPHPDFWLQPELVKRMAVPPPAPTTKRRYQVMFAGAGTPDTRAAALSALKPLADAAGDGWFWRVYRDGSGSSAPALNQFDYLDVMDASDFALCPPGWCPWTHRLMEAVTRSTIPIADASECRAAGLVDGETAVFVHDNDWPAAVKVAQSLSPDALARMRSALIPHAAPAINPQASGERLCASLGLV